jgi:hypothetical protein
MSAFPIRLGGAAAAVPLAAKSAPATANVIATTRPKRRAVDGGRSIGTACLPGS